MGRFLNSITPVDAYRSTVSGKYFVDKSKLIGELIPELGMDERFFCFTRPRRFGKSIMANMISSTSTLAKYPEPAKAISNTLTGSRTASILILPKHILIFQLI